MARSYSLRVVLGLVGSLSICLAAAIASAAEPAIGLAADSPAVSDKLRQLMQDRKYPEAVQAIDEAAKAKDARRDSLLRMLAEPAAGGQDAGCSMNAASGSSSQGANRLVPRRSQSRPKRNGQCCEPAAQAGCAADWVKK